MPEWGWQWLTTVHAVSVQFDEGVFGLPAQPPPSLPADNELVK